MPISTAVLDACVLYPAPLRDLLMQLAQGWRFRARWTARIHDEWIRNVLAKRPELSREQLNRTRDLMDAHAHDAVVDDFEPLISGLTLPDPNDRHVLAAAIRCGAEVIVTFNLKDFPSEILGLHNLEAVHPDEFLARLIDQDLVGVCTAANIVRGRLKHPPISAESYLDTLDRQGLSRSVARLRTCVGLI